MISMSRCCNPKFLAQSPAQLFGRGAQRQVRLRANQIDDGFGLG
jgi:hypothetical protein